MCLFCRNLRETRCGCKLCSMPPDRLTHAAILLSTRRLRLTKPRNIGRSWHSLSTSCRSLKSINQSTCHHRGRAPGLVVELGERCGKMIKDVGNFVENRDWCSLKMAGGLKGDLEILRDGQKLKTKAATRSGPMQKSGCLSLHVRSCWVSTGSWTETSKTQKISKENHQMKGDVRPRNHKVLMQICAEYVQIRMIQIYTDL